MANRWANKPQGIDIPAEKSITADELKGYDFVVITLGSPDGINTMLAPQSEAARAAGIPVIGVYKLDPKLYVERGSDPWETWDMNIDPNIAQMHFRYYLDRMIKSGDSLRYIHAVMLDGRNVLEGKNVDGSTKYVLGDWWVKVASYYANVCAKRYKLPWFIFMDRASMVKMNAFEKVEQWIYNAGSNSAVAVVPAEGNIPSDVPIPQHAFIANAIDLWMWKGARWLYNGTKASLYDLLGFKPAVVAPPTDDPDEPGEPPVVTGDLAAVMALLATIEAKLDRLANVTVTFGTGD